MLMMTSLSSYIVVLTYVCIIVLICMHQCAHRPLCMYHCAHMYICVYIIVLTCVFVRCCAQMYVHHCTHQHRPSDPVTLGELMMPPHGGKESKLKLPEKRKVSKRPFSYLAAMDSPNGNHAHNIHI